MILLWGTADDPPLAAVAAALDRRGAAHVLVDERAPVPASTRFRFGDRLEGRVGPLDLDTVAAAFIRPQGVHLGTVRGAEQARLHACLLAWTELTPALVVTRLSAQASNTSKLWQAVTAREVGFEVPDSLATTEPAAARAFVDGRSGVIYKSLSSVRSIVRRLPPGERDRLEDVRACPTLFQAHIEGVDHRVHVVGSATFATMVVSESDDYRYDQASERVAVELPGEVTDRCRALAEALALPVAGIDLRRTPEGRWVCFEANPAPAFPYFEAGTEIADAVAALLDGPPPAVTGAGSATPRG